MKLIRRFLFTMMPACDEAKYRMWFSVHGIALSLGKWLGLRAHLCVCPNCRGYLKSLKWVGKTFEQLPDAPRFGAGYKLSDDQAQLLREKVAKQARDS